ncbi:MAG: hypothetical protein KKC46_00735 [Proteobacteria bacterium]|nr:hypothetical protein [Pseudomonadota bacterium]
MRLKVGILSLYILFSFLLLCPTSWAITLSFNPTTSSIGVAAILGEVKKMHNITTQNKS